MVIDKSCIADKQRIVLNELSKIVFGNQLYIKTCLISSLDKFLDCFFVRWRIFIIRVDKDRHVVLFLVWLNLTLSLKIFFYGASQQMPVFFGNLTKTQRLYTLQYPFIFLRKCCAQ